MLILTFRHFEKNCERFNHLRRCWNVNVRIIIRFGEPNLIILIHRESWGRVLDVEGIGTTRDSDLDIVVFRFAQRIASPAGTTET